MDVTITGLPADMTMQELATRCRLYRKYGYAAEVEPEQSKKPLHTQAAEILGHIHNKDYGLAESKAGLLRDQLQKGDWTLGTGTKTELPDDGFVRMCCDGIGESSDYGDHAALLRILEIVNRLNCSDARKDVIAIKSMKSVERIITEWSAQLDEYATPPESSLIDAFEKEIGACIANLEKAIADGNYSTEDHAQGSLGGLKYGLAIYQNCKSM